MEFLVYFSIFRKKLGAEINNKLAAGAKCSVQIVDLSHKNVHFFDHKNLSFFKIP